MYHKHQEKERKLTTTIKAKVHQPIKWEETLQKWNNTQAEKRTKRPAFCGRQSAMCVKIPNRGAAAKALCWHVTVTTLKHQSPPWAQQANLMPWILNSRWASPAQVRDAAGESSRTDEADGRAERSKSDKEPFCPCCLWPRRKGPRTKEPQRPLQAEEGSGTGGKEDLNPTRDAADSVRSLKESGEDFIVPEPPPIEPHGANIWILLCVTRSGEARPAQQAPDLQNRETVRRCRLRLLLCDEVLQRQQKMNMHVLMSFSFPPRQDPTRQTEPRKPGSPDGTQARIREGALKQEGRPAHTASSTEGFPRSCRGAFQGPVPDSLARAAQLLLGAVTEESQHSIGTTQVRIWASGNCYFKQ